MIRREPLGVTVGICPWNYPLMMAAWKLGPALAAGNTSVLKPAEMTPRTALRLGELATDIFPPGVINVVTGHGSEVGDQLVRNPDVRLVSVTGDTSTGKIIMAAASETVKRVHLELGGKAPVLVFDDADVDSAAKLLAFGKFRNAGQVCVSPTRFLVQENVYERFVGKFTEHAKALKVGNGMEQGNTMGALANSRRTVAMDAHVADAKKSGGKIRTGGHRIGDKGNFYEPTVVTELPNDARAMNEEPFGPMAIINPFKSFDDAVTEANRLPFGLAAYAWTKSAKTANAIAAEVETGMISINHVGLGIPETPFGGVKDSGYGSEGGSEAIESYMNPKFISQAGI
jgi:succinate-semialdehyde dehydrogenase/glutarate-semialdehyde dehydrogenase